MRRQRQGALTTDPAAGTDHDDTAAARISRRNLYDYYSGYLPKADREPLLALLDPTD